jgi:hypothetical protein
MEVAQTTEFLLLTSLLFAACPLPISDLKSHEIRGPQFLPQLLHPVDPEYELLLLDEKPRWFFRFSPLTTSHRSHT